MKIKYKILLPSLLTCLALGSISCYGNGGTNKTNGDSTTKNTHASIRAPLATSTYTNSNGGYSYSSNNNNTGLSGSKNSSKGISTFSNGSTMSPASGTNACSTMDFSVFEETDEENVYNTYGFTRGDIKNLYIYKYDPKSEQTISGNVEKILRVQFPDGNCYLIAVLNTDNGSVLVNLGPVWFADENNLVVNEGDRIEVIGSTVRTNGRYIVIASRLKKNDQNLQLRNQSGNPQWGSPKSQKGTNTPS